jgi:hypothetical protein
MTIALCLQSDNELVRFRIMSYCALPSVQIMSYCALPSSQNIELLRSPDKLYSAFSSDNELCALQIMSELLRSAFSPDNEDYCALR